MKSLSRGMPLALMARPTSTSVPYESAVSMWVRPLERAVLRTWTSSGFVGSSSGRALIQVVPVPKPSWERGVSNKTG
jgi:hypothetical protein